MSMCRCGRTIAAQSVYQSCHFLRAFFGATRNIAAYNREGKNMKFELFGDRADWLVAPFLASALVFAFYGLTAGLLALAVALAFSNLRPVLRWYDERLFASVWVSAAIIAFSPFLRSWFFFEYCSTAPWSVYRALHVFEAVGPSCFIANGYFQYALDDGWRSVLRDILMPVGGLALLMALAKSRFGVVPALAALLVFLLALFLSQPLLKQDMVNSADEVKSVQTSPAPSVSDKIASPSASPSAEAKVVPLAAPAQLPKFADRLQGRWAKATEECDTEQEVQITPSTWTEHGVVASLRKHKKRPDGYEEYTIEWTEGGKPYEDVKLTRYASTGVELSEHVEEDDFLLEKYISCS